MSPGFQDNFVIVKRYFRQTCLRIHTLTHKYFIINIILIAIFPKALTEEKNGIGDTD